MDLAVALRSFVRTVERGSITAAARDLKMSQPAVTKHLKRLEGHVGARLLERSSRLLRLTPQGQALFEASRSALASIESALEGVRRDMGAIDGCIRVHAPSCIGAKHLHPIVIAFQAKHPAVAVELILENRSVDLIHENYDLAIKYGQPEGQSLIIRRLGLVRRVLVAAPAFLKKYGPIKTLERFSEVRVITTPSVLSSRNTIPLQANGKTVEVPVKAVLRTNDAHVVAATLIAGQAAGPVQHLLVSEELRSKRLVRILRDYEVRSTEAFFTYPSARFMRPAVRAFTDFAVNALRDVEGIIV